MTRYVFPSVSGEQWTTKAIDDELRENGVKINIEGKAGHYISKMIGFEMEISPKIARGRFVVGPNSSEPNGELIRGIADYIAEGIGSATGAAAAASHLVSGIELNLTHLRPAYVGQEVVVLCKPLRLANVTQVWEIKFETEHMQESKTEPGVVLREMILIAVARLTLVVQSSRPTIGEVGKLEIRSKL